MQRTTIMLPSNLKIAAQEHAKSLGISVGKLIRDTLQQRLEKQQQNNENDVLFSSLSIYQGDTPSNLSAEHDKYLYGNEK